MKCKNCGANINPSPNSKFIKCKYCGSHNDVIKNEPLQLQNNNYKNAYTMVR